MKVRIIHQYFRYPAIGGALRSYYIARALVKRGHDVQVITGGNPEDFKDLKLSGRGKFNLTVIPSSRVINLSGWQRFKNYLSFSLRASWKVIFSKKHDVYYCSSTPLFVGIPGLFAKLFGKKFIFEIRDIWPYVPFSLGLIKNPILIRLLNYLEKTILHSASHVVVLSPEMQTYYKPKWQHKISIITNMSDTELFQPSQIQNSDSKIMITYAGSLGYVNDISFIESFIHQIHDSDQFSLQVYGQGAFASQIKNLIEKLDDKDISYHSFQSKSELADALQQSDYVLVSYVQNEALWTGSPNRFFDGLAAGNAIILNFKGWCYDLIHKHQCGIYLSDDFSLNQIITDKDHIQQMKANSRKLAESAFSTNQQTAKIIDILENKLN